MDRLICNGKYTVKNMTAASMAVLLAVGVGGRTAAASDDGSDFSLEEITVTAQKREQSLGDVPVVVNVLTRETISDYNIDDLFELANFVPGVVFSRAPDDGLALTIRGLGTPARTQSFDQSVALFLDNMFVGKGRMYSAAFFDIERVEIIKGTQSTLLGKNTSLGAMSVVTRKPGSEFSGEVRAGYEMEYGGLTLDAGIDAPVSDTFALRFAGHYVNKDGWVENAATGNQVPADKDIGLRVTGVYSPNENMSLTLSYQYSDSERQGNGYQFVDETGGLLDPALGDGVLDGTKTSYTSRGKDGESFHDTEINSFNATLDWTLGAHTLTSVSSYASYDMNFVDDFDFGLKDATDFLRVEDYWQFSQEVRLASESGIPFEYMAGLFYFKSDWDSLETQIYDTPVQVGPDPFLTIFSGTFANAFTQKTETWSAFAQGTWNISDRLRFMGGLRYTDEKKDATFGREQSDGVTLWNTVINPPFAVTPLEFDDKFLNGNASIQYDVSDTAMVYASFGVGTKTGGFAESAAVFAGDPSLATIDGGSRIETETTTAYEIGTKASLFGGKASLNAALFLTEIDDFQETSFTGASFDTLNVPVRSIGGEFDLTWQLTPELRFNTAWTFIDAKVTGDDERELAEAPTATGHAGFLYERPISDSLLLKTTGFIRHRSSMIHQRLANFDSEPLTTFDASIGVGADDGSWDISLSGTNIFNAVSADFSGPPADPTLDPSITVDAPSQMRTIYLQGSFRF
ncbi:MULTISPECIES: TonB-dependent receptor [Kordiimonas]|jgi:iron complex outermembrane receptor protein|uniref:TonB-dependent receptor n=1 Tax=Kordiimonas TaxID=288021 RepID=UPI00257ED46A|nr:TonB-dependent receptor [Kordiimonas sp. UBA4487]